MTMGEECVNYIRCKYFGAKNSVEEFGGKNFGEVSTGWIYRFFLENNIQYLSLPCSSFIQNAHTTEDNDLSMKCYHQQNLSTLEAIF